MINNNSDLDIILRTPKKLPFNMAKNIIHEISKLNLKFDIQEEIGDNEDLIGAAML